MSIDRATARWLRRLAEAGAALGVRERYALLASENGPGPAMAGVEDVTVPTASGGVPVRILTPTHSPGAVVVFFHGGGWVAGSIDESDTVVRKLAERTGCTFVSVGYRLAPEHPFPAAVDDAYAAVEWVAERVVGADVHAPAEARDSTSGVPLLVCGEEAGGNLAAVVARRAARRAGPRIAQQILIAPFADFDVERPSYLEPDNQEPFRRTELAGNNAAYLNGLDGRQDSDAAPLAEAVGGPEAGLLAPALVITAEHDPLRDGGADYARLLGDAGVPVTHEQVAGAPHGFFSVLQLHSSERAFQLVVRSVRAVVAASRQPA